MQIFGNEVENFCLCKILSVFFACIFHVNPPYCLQFTLRLNAAIPVACTVDLY